MGRLLSKVSAPLTALILGGVVLYAIGRWDQNISERDSALDKQTAAALRSYEGWHKAYASATIASATYRAASEVQHRRAESAIRVADSLQYLLRTETPALLASAKTCQDSVSVLGTAFSRCQEQADSLRSANTALVRDTVAISSDRNVWKALSVRADSTIDSLKTSMVAQQEARDCRILFFPCPSRTVTAVVSLLLGLGLGKL